MSPLLSRHECAGLSYLRGGRGTPLLLLHGIPGSSHTWEEAGRLLASRYDVIIPDLGGFGESDPLEHLSHDFYMEAHADAIHGLLDELSVRNFFLGGYDFGGPVALTLLRLFPAHAVEGLILSATNLFTDRAFPVPYRVANVPVLGTVFFRLFAGTRLGLRLLYWGAAHNKAAFRAADFDRHLTPSGLDQTWRLLRRSCADLHGRYEQIETLLSDLEVPTLVICGDRDPFFSVEDAKGLANALPYATLTILEETGHFVPEERPEMVAWHVDDFLQAPRKRAAKTRTQGSTSA